jgi:carbonic anhydrase/acetyltransferase-like protein (isoleucine patch superfamily)
MTVVQLEDHAPQLHASAWVAPTATVLGRVRLAAGSSVWYGAVLRGDNDGIEIGENSNVQDGSVLHTDHGFPLRIDAGVTIGHQVMLHGCHIGEGSLVGIQAVLLNGARIGKNCLVAAGALVTEGKVFPDGTMIMGSPAKVVRDLRPEELARLKFSALHYVEQAIRHRERARVLA